MVIHTSAACFKSFVKASSKQKYVYINTKLDIGTRADRMIENF